VTSKWSMFFKSRNGKIATAAAIAVVLIIGAIVVFSGHLESYNRGHEDARGGIPTGVNTAPSEMCSTTLQMEQTEHSDINADEYTQGCLDGYAEQGRR
jgi:hypothetical protein